MNPSDGPPAQNTHSAAAHTACYEQMCKSTPHHEESILTSIANSQSDRQSMQPNENIHSRSEHKTIHKMQEETQGQKQSYTTAPRSLGISARTNRQSTPEEQRCGLSVVLWDNEESNHHWNRSKRSHRPSDEWSKMVDKWAARAEKNRADLINLRRKIENGLNELHTEVENSIQTNTEMMDEFSNLQCMARHAPSCNQHKEQYELPPSPQTLAIWAIYADRGSNEGTVNYKLWRNTQARLSIPQVTEQSRIMGDDKSNVLYQVRSVMDWSHPCSKFYARQMASLRTYKESHNQMSGWNRIESSHSRLFGYSSNEDKQLQQNNGARSCNHPTSTAGPRHNALDQDYARWSMSLQPPQPIAPVTTPIWGQMYVPQVSAKHNHENNMIDSLRCHIHKSLTEIPDDLPELKGI